MPFQTFEEITKRKYILDYWVEPIVAIAIFISLLVFLNGGIIISNTPISPKSFLLPNAIPIILLICWSITREIYWRSGRKRKIAIAYHGFEARPADWSYLKKYLYRTHDESNAERWISLRNIPYSPVENNQDAIKFCKKYKFDVIFRATHIEISPESSKTRWSFEPLIVSEKMNSSDFESMVETMAAIASVPVPSIRSTLDILKTLANSNYELLLWFIGSISYLEKDFKNARQVYEELDRLLGLRVNADTQVRIRIRTLIAFAIANKSFFPPNEPPIAEALENAIEKCDEAMELYSIQVSQLHNLQSRNYFYARDYEKGINLLNNLLGVHTISPEQRLTAHFNRAVLYFFMEDYNRARKDFVWVKTHGGIEEFKDQQIVEFADFAREYGIESAVVLQFTYRKILRKKIPKGLKTDFTIWINSNQNAKIVIKAIG